MLVGGHQQRTGPGDRLSFDAVGVGRVPANDRNRRWEGIDRFPRGTALRRCAAGNVARGGRAQERGRTDISSGCSAARPGCPAARHDSRSRRPVVGNPRSPLSAERGPRGSEHHGEARGTGMTRTARERSRVLRSRATRPLVARNPLRRFPLTRRRFPQPEAPCRRRPAWRSWNGRGAAAGGGARWAAWTAAVVHPRRG